MSLARIGRILVLVALGFVINASIFLAGVAAPIATVYLAIIVIDMLFLALAGSFYRPTTAASLEVYAPFVGGMFLGFTWAGLFIG